MISKRLTQANNRSSLSDNAAIKLRAALGTDGSLLVRDTDRYARAHDASHFVLVPTAVAVPTNTAAVGQLIGAARELGLPLTFRSGGTSLSGQAGTTGLLVDTKTHFRGIEILDNGLRVRVGPGTTVREVNTRLVQYGRKLGPDPASEVACTLGGVVANNSSGMACGTTANSYATLESLQLVLPSGTVLDTSAPDADAQLFAYEPELYKGLLRLRDRVRTELELRDEIRRQFAMKNTMGYGLNSLLDFDSPADILAHLVVGSEGTLAFIGSITLRTVPLLSYSRTGLLVFDDLSAATAALPDLVATAPVAIELLDSASLRVGQRDPAAGAELRGLRVTTQAALLVEYQGESRESADTVTATATQMITRLPMANPWELTADPSKRAAMWHIRKGLYAMVAEARPSGTTALLEDVVVPVSRLLPTCERLTDLFDRHGYEDAVIFGHAKDGNLHFMLTEQLGDNTPLNRFTQFTEDMVDLILSEGGSLKAEHGTGRMMAPFVLRQYGAKLYEVMREIKHLCDPNGVLNPGAVLSDDSQIHLQHLKVTPPVEEEVDRCVECGFCEPVCPSRTLTTTPRQRIVLRREIVRAKQTGDVDLAARLEKEYDYDAVQTCAADGMCQTTCPVLINTGSLMKRLRSEQTGRAAEASWAVAARHWGGVTRGAAIALTVAEQLPATIAKTVTRVGRTLADTDSVPQWSADLPAGGKWFAATAPDRPAEAIMFSSCTGTMFDSGAGGPGVARAFARLCERAGVVVLPPTGAGSFCCGTPWQSKGLRRGYAEMAARVLPSLWKTTLEGSLPVVSDASSCTEGLRHMIADGPAEYRSLQVLDAVEFCATRLLPALTVSAPLPDIVLHPTCSSTRMGLTRALHEVAEAIADDVMVPDSWGCCGFAGDRGMLHPELTAAATKDQAAEIMSADHTAFASCNRTCELGMTRATGQPYVHILELVEQATRNSEPSR